MVPRTNDSINDCECGGNCVKRKFDDTRFTYGPLTLSVSLDPDSVNSSANFDLQGGDVFIAHRFLVADISGDTSIKFRMKGFPQMKLNEPLAVTNNILPFELKLRPFQTIRSTSGIELSQPAAGLTGDATVVFLLEGVYCRSQDIDAARDFLYQVLK